jgi:hypothetical protein
MHRRRRDAKEARDVGLRGRAPIYERIGVDEGEILTLSGAEILWRITSRSIHQESSIFEGER